MDRIGKVIELTDDALERTPDTLTGPSRDFISGVFKLDDRLMLALDVRRALDTSSRR